MQVIAKLESAFSSIPIHISQFFILDYPFLTRSLLKWFIYFAGVLLPKALFIFVIITCTVKVAIALTLTYSASFRISFFIEISL